MFQVNGRTIFGLTVSLSRMTGGPEVGRWTLYVSATLFGRTRWFSREPGSRHDRAGAGMGWFHGRRAQR